MSPIRLTALVFLCGALMFGAVGIGIWIGGGIGGLVGMGVLIIVAALLAEQDNA